MHPWFTAPPFFRLINCAPKECYHEIRFEKDSRYYVIRLNKDLLEDWVITLINGRIKSKLGQSRTLAFADFDEGFEHFCALARIRNLRGYQLTTIACDNHLMLHLLPFVVHTEDKKELSATKTKSINQRELQDKKRVAIVRNVLPQATSKQLGFGF